MQIFMIESTDWWEEEEEEVEEKEEGEGEEKEEDDLSIDIKMFKIGWKLKKI